MLKGASAWFWISVLLLVGLLATGAYAFTLADDYNELAAKASAQDQNRVVAYNELVDKAKAQDQKRIDDYNELAAKYNELRSQALQNIDDYNKLAADYNKLTKLRSVIENVGTIALRGFIGSLTGGFLP